ncbi:hypothetical protein [Pseudogulbenkiania ferrooxidans]|uniref:Uncharacterized protein n=1 Tax=Pseudogulbenkiania ferrooxidans 2002 TaxID=279714 RepID=B9Z805_9NEIS|nr:hypothetical protein [Pseudogulbenkiania ferrooxidans]EEG07060.1 hypothetical protein FuraDRAFT_3491 [Pseudogulbenkiania ferrooxidans 2002]
MSIESRHHAISMFLAFVAILGIAALFARYYQVPLKDLLSVGPYLLIGMFGCFGYAAHTVVRTVLARRAGVFYSTAGAARALAR